MDNASLIPVRYCKGRDFEFSTGSENRQVYEHLLNLRYHKLSSNETVAMSCANIYVALLCETRRWTKQSQTFKTEFRNLKLQKNTLNIFQTYNYVQHLSDYMPCYIKFNILRNTLRKLQAGERRTPYCVDQQSQFQIYANVIMWECWQLFRSTCFQWYSCC